MFDRRILSQYMTSVWLDVSPWLKSQTLGPKICPSIAKIPRFRTTNLETSPNMAVDHFQSLTVLFFWMANPFVSPALCEILRNSPSILSIPSIPSIAAALHSCLHRILRHGRKNGDGSREGARESCSSTRWDHPHLRQLGWDHGITPMLRGIFETLKPPIGSQCLVSLVIPFTWNHPLKKI